MPQFVVRNGQLVDLNVVLGVDRTFEDDIVNRIAALEGKVDILESLAHPKEKSVLLVHADAFAELQNLLESLGYENEDVILAAINAINELSDDADAFEADLLLEQSKAKELATLNDALRKALGESVKMIAAMIADMANKIK